MARARRLAACAVIAFVPFVRVAAQNPKPPTPGRIKGRVVADYDKAPIAGAEVIIPATGRTVRTDSLGAYDIPGLAAETTLVIVRAPGFVTDSMRVPVRPRLVVSLQFRLADDRDPGPVVLQRTAGNPAAQPLPEVKTEGKKAAITGRLTEFYDRQKEGVGKFLDRATLAKWEDRRVSDALSTVGTLRVQTGGLKAWVANGRVDNTTCAFCRPVTSPTEVLDRADFSAGARPACFMDVWVDGNRVYQSGLTPPQPLFNVNSIEPSAIEGIEVYASVATIPAKYSTASGTQCGVMIIWTRDPEQVKKP